MCILCVSKEVKRQHRRPTSKTSSEGFRTRRCHLTKLIWKQRNLERLASESKMDFGLCLSRASEKSFLWLPGEGSGAGWKPKGVFFGTHQEAHPTNEARKGALEAKRARKSCGIFGNREQPTRLGQPKCQT